MSKRGIRSVWAAEFDACGRGRSFNRSDLPPVDGKHAPLHRTRRFWIWAAAVCPMEEIVFGHDDPFGDVEDDVRGGELLLRPISTDVFSIRFVDGDASESRFISGKLGAYKEKTKIGMVKSIYYLQSADLGFRQRNIAFRKAIYPSAEKGSGIREHYHEFLGD